MPLLFTGFSHGIAFEPRLPILPKEHSPALLTSLAFVKAPLAQRLWNANLLVDAVGLQAQVKFFETARPLALPGGRQKGRSDKASQLQEFWCSKPIRQLHLVCHLGQNGLFGSR